MTATRTKPTFSFSRRTTVLAQCHCLAICRTDTKYRYQYGFYSTDPAFEHPSGTRFLAARTMLTQDFNNDGKDDVVFVQSGPDYAPYVPARNEILLSTENGYQSRYLSSDRSLFHGGAAGDFDGDGDVDIVTTPGAKSEITILLNDGAGRLIPTKRLRGFGRNYNVKAWDIDRDGNLFRGFAS